MKNQQILFKMTKIYKSMVYSITQHDPVTLHELSSFFLHLINHAKSYLFAYKTKKNVTGHDETQNFAINLNLMGFFSDNRDRSIKN